MKLRSGNTYVVYLVSRHIIRGCMTNGRTKVPVTPSAISLRGKGLQHEILEMEKLQMT